MTTTRLVGALLAVVLTVSGLTLVAPRPAEAMTPTCVEGLQVQSSCVIEGPAVINQLGCVVSEMSFRLGDQCVSLSQPDPSGACRPGSEPAWFEPSACASYSELRLIDTCPADHARFGSTCYRTERAQGAPDLVCPADAELIFDECATRRFPISATNSQCEDGFGSVYVGYKGCQRYEPAPLADGTVPDYDCLGSRAGQPICDYRPTFSQFDQTAQLEAGTPIDVRFQGCTGGTISLIRRDEVGFVDGVFLAESAPGVFTGEYEVAESGQHLLQFVIVCPTPTPLFRLNTGVMLVEHNSPLPLEGAFATPAFTCADGFRFTIAGGVPNYTVGFRIDPPSGGGVSDVLLAAVYGEAGTFTRAVRSSYLAGVTYPVTMWLGDGAGGSVVVESSFTPDEDCVPGPAPQDAPAGYVSLSPRRIIDSRSEPSLNIGPFSTPWAPAWSRPIDATTTLSGVPEGATAIAMHVTTVNGDAPFSWLTFYPTQGSAPTAASINFGTSPLTTPITNDLVITRIDSNGNFTIANEAGSTDLVIDVVGYFTPDSEASFVATVPERVADSRSDPALNVGPYQTPWSPGTTRTINIAGAASAPNGIVAVAAHVTTVNADAPFSWLTIHPSGEPRPTTASINFGTSPLTTPITNDLVITGVDSDGNFEIYNEQGSTDIVVDIVGYYTTAPTAGAGKYKSLSPVRIVDSRPGVALNTGPFSTPWLAAQVRSVDATTTLSTIPATATAVVAHVTTVNADSPFSWLTTYPTGIARPTVASMNFGTSAVSAPITNDTIITKIDDEGNFDIYNSSGSTDVVIDIVGYFE